MDWPEVLRLMHTDEFRVGVLLLLIGSIFAIPKAIAALSAWLRRRAYAGYASSISFGQGEVEKALRGYVHQQGMTSDPSAKMDLSDALAAPRESVFTMLDSFVLGQSAERHLFVFADCGMGKTTLLINYFHRKRKWLRRKNVSIVLVCLSKDGYLQEIEAVPLQRRPETVILMDAFDEDPLVVEGVKKRLDLIIRMTASFKAVVISCRSQFFSSDAEIPTSTGELRAGPTPPGRSKALQFERIYLAPFDEKRVARYLRLAFPGLLSLGRRAEAKKLVNRFPSLVMRPMLLAHISEIMDSDRDSSLMSQADIYQAIVAGWAKRESHWIPATILLRFSKKFALNIFDRRHERGGEYCSKEELTSMAQGWGVQVRSDLLAGRSLLNRTEDGRCKFAHRSILEYFISEGILDGSSPEKLELTSQIGAFLFDRLGVRAEAMVGKLDIDSRVELVEAEKRLGYSTNFNLMYEDAMELDPASIYGLSIINELDEDVCLGEHLEGMLGATKGGGDLVDVRISVSAGKGMVSAYISIWSERKATLSHAKISASQWFSVVGRRWSSRSFFNVVGRFDPVRLDVANIRYRLSTFCNSAEDSLGVDSAESCKTLSVGLDETGTTVRLIPGFVDRGPWAPFGILRGGSTSLVEGRKFATISERVWNQNDASLPGRVIDQEEAIVPAAERWQVRDRG